MVKPAGPGVYTATYSNVCALKLLLGMTLNSDPTTNSAQVPVYEFQFGEALKEHGQYKRRTLMGNLLTHIISYAPSSR